MTDAQAKKAARAFAEKFENDCRGDANFDDTMTLNEWVEQYFQTIAPEKLRVAVIEHRQKAFRKHILPALGGKSLRELSTARLAAHFAKLKEKLAPSSINTIRLFLSVALTAAVKHKVINANPLHGVDALRHEKQKQAVLTPAQFGVFIDGLAKIENIGVRGLLVTQLFTGARPGELRALTWDDINFEKGLIHINKGVDEKGRVGPPKSRASDRVLKIAPFLLNFLLKQRRDVEYCAVGMGSAWTDKGLCFPSPTGWYLYPAALSRAIKKIKKGGGIPSGLHAHSLRHTFASIMIGDGADIKTVQDTLGHGSANITLNTYAHSFSEARAAAMDSVGGAIGRAAGGALDGLLIHG